MAGLQVLTPKQEPALYILESGTNLICPERVPGLLWTIQASTLPRLRQGQEVLPRDPNADAREWGATTALPPHANLMLMSACNPYSFCSRAFRKDIRVCSGASCKGKGGEGGARVPLVTPPQPVGSLPCWEVCFSPWLICGVAVATRAPTQLL